MGAAGMTHTHMSKYGIPEAVAREKKSDNGTLRIK